MENLEPAHPVVLAVALTKGGTGKTTTAVNLAAALAARSCDNGGGHGRRPVGEDPDRAARRAARGSTSEAPSVMAGRRVVLVDADPQAQAHGALGAAESDGLARVLEVGSSTATADQDGAAAGVLVRDVRPCLDVCPAGAELAVESARLGADPAAGLLAIGDALDAIARASSGDAAPPVVVVDVPPGWGPLALGVLAAADVVVSPVALHPLALQALGAFVGHLDGVQRTRARFGGADGRRLPLLGWIVPTMHDVRAAAPTQVLDAIRAAAAEMDRGDGGHPTVAEPVRHSVRVQEAAALGRTVAEHDPGHVAADAYDALADDVARTLAL